MMRKNVFANIRPTKINFYLRFMALQGFSKQDVLAGTNLDSEKLQSSDAIVEISDFILVVSNMMRLINSETLAFQLGDIFQPSDLGILGYSVAACKNVLEAGNVWARYNSLFFGNLISEIEHQDNESLWYEFIPQVKLPPHLLQYFMEENANLETALFRKFNKYKAKDSFFSFTYPAPAHSKLYEKLLQSEIKFNADKNVYIPNTKDKNYLAPFPFADKETLTALQKYLEEQTNLIYSQTCLTDKVRIIIHDHLPRILTIDEMAEKFKCSKRTFFRNLKNEGATYYHILEEVRLKLVKNYLATTLLTVDEIADMLGYADTGSLRRAVKMSTGMTIRDIKQSLLHRHNNSLTPSTAITRYPNKTPSI